VRLDKDQTGDSVGNKKMLPRRETLQSTAGLAAWHAGVAAHRHRTCHGSHTNTNTNTDAAASDAAVGADIKHSTAWNGWRLSSFVRADKLFGSIRRLRDRQRRQRALFRTGARADMAGWCVCGAQRLISRRPFALSFTPLVNYRRHFAMKKSLLALAVLATIAGAASAQSSVTVYGKVDLGLVLDNGSPAGLGKSVRISSGVTGGSRIGFKGVEDLGGGMKASFQLETGYCADSAAGAPNFCTGSNSFMGRQAHGDLSGPFGTLSAGRQYSLGFNNLATVDPFGTGLAGNADNTDGAGNYMIDPSGFRLNNSATYTTPGLAGFTASGEIALGEQTGDWESNRETGASVNYASGPAYAGVTYYNLSNTNSGGNARRVITGGGVYDFGVLKVHALVQKVTGSPTGGQETDVLTLMGGVTIPLAGGSVLASYIHHDDRTSFDRDASQLAAGYMYPLSKRTSIYTAYGRIENRNGAKFLIGNATETGTGAKGFDLGVVHNF
jgi:predicted porin